MDDTHHIIEMKEQIGRLESKLETSELSRQQGHAIQEEIRINLETLNKRMAAMPDNEHREHHDYMREIIREHKQRREMYQRVTQRVMTGGVWALICGLSALFWAGLQDFFHK